ncbi:DNA-binding CsgD family transcriptional regulator [Sinobacterium caligoides]|uniref:DNA-binding CsgD family transcriptional regulator n=1 Tax=Sinobacterium caligoides TaxID=933926 RepID=A0A3N2DNF1_9GAMM|nr:LuxR C-terminal-related transcriptional regulator [Sinobacterium caligoides]ROS01179.1 DNA-binding CsgD family transcriptional regulator [Sinobacterium caligoides]
MVVLPEALIRSIYAGVLDENRWELFLVELRQCVDASFATLLLKPPSKSDRGFVLNAFVTDPDDVLAYNNNYYALDPFVNLPEGKVVSIEEHVDMAGFKSSRYYTEYMQPLKIEQIMGFDFSLADGVDVRLRITRNEGALNFAHRERYLLEMLLPHLRQAVEIYMRLQGAEMESCLYSEAMGEMALGVIILSEKAEVIRYNEAAKRLFTESNGLSLRHGKLCLERSEENRQLQQLVARLIERHVSGRAVASEVFKTEYAPGALRLAIQLRSLPCSTSPSANQPCVALFVSDPQHRRKAPTSALATLFGFTPSEAALSMLLANGLTLDEASEELGVSRNTTKSHLSAVFSKTGVTRQTKLIQLILKSVGPVSEDGY